MASHRRAGKAGLTQSNRITMLPAAAATAAVALSIAPAAAEPQDSPGEIRSAVGRLHVEAERATEKYHAAGERYRRLSAEAERLSGRVARGQERVNRLRGVLGSIAGAQYRTGGVDPGLRLLLSSDPDTYLARAVALNRVSERQAGQLRSLRRAQTELRKERARAAGRLAEAERSREAVSRHKRTVESRLVRARRLLDSLGPEQREEHRRAARDGGRTEFPGGGTAASGRAAAAVAAARAAVGRPYVWGATGPGAFDCSGLTYWSYQQAGVTLPRTSQAQRLAGRRVPLSEARPGDLVTYRTDASHVGMYVGNGQIVHAPHPGAAVRYDPVGLMPNATVTRV
ncbi:NlpC/P60 family protein [Streptomyces albus]|uniref:C40 family peptidase n=1 Tax=Streptomyces albus TaxID=1888 RepID=UPI0004C4BE75|nr:C40 family peptidase [Streptomyces albus]